MSSNKKMTSVLTYLNISGHTTTFTYSLFKGNSVKTLNKNLINLEIVQYFSYVSFQYQQSCSTGQRIDYRSVDCRLMDCQALLYDIKDNLLL